MLEFDSGEENEARVHHGRRRRRQVQNSPEESEDVEKKQKPSREEFLQSVN